MDVYENIYGNSYTDVGHVVVGFLAVLGLVWIWEQYQKHRKEKIEKSELDEKVKKYFE